MAEEDDDEGKTEQASARRLQQAFDEGKVPLSREAAAVAGLAAGCATLLAFAPALQDSLILLVRASLQAGKDTHLGSIAGASLRPTLLTLAVAGVAALSTVALFLVQTRGGFWSERVLPDLTRLFEPQRLTRMVSREFFADFAFALFKVSAVGVVLWLSLRSELSSLVRMLTLPGELQLAAAFRPVAKAAPYALGVLAVAGALDFALNRFRFLSQMKMTKEELRREAKEDEGDPLIRSRRRRQHREFARGRAAQEVPRADALIVNPTHVAVAVRYRKSNDGAPRVTAKGKGKLAEIMRELARSHAVPIVQDIPLARLLHKRVKVGQEVPADTYRAVAAVLAVVYRMTGKPPGTGSDE